MVVDANDSEKVWQFICLGWFLPAKMSHCMLAGEIRRFSTPAHAWWHHNIKPHSTLLATSNGSPTVASGFPSQRSNNAYRWLIFVVVQTHCSWYNRNAGHVRRYDMHMAPLTCSWIRKHLFLPGSEARLSTDATRTWTFRPQRPFWRHTVMFTRHRAFLGFCGPWKVAEAGGYQSLLANIARLQNSYIYIYPISGLHTSTGLVSQLWRTVLF